MESTTRWQEAVRRGLGWAPPTYRAAAATLSWNEQIACILNTLFRRLKCLYLRLYNIIVRGLTVGKEGNKSLDSVGLKSSDIGLGIFV